MIKNSKNGCESDGVMKVIYEDEWSDLEREVKRFRQFRKPHKRGRHRLDPL